MRHASLSTVQVLLGLAPLKSLLLQPSLFPSQETCSAAFAMQLSFVCFSTNHAK
jgi:hypothetical protein